VSREGQSSVEDNCSQATCRAALLHSLILFFLDVRCLLVLWTKIQLVVVKVGFVSLTRTVSSCIVQWRSSQWENRVVFVVDASFLSEDLSSPIYFCRPYSFQCLLLFLISPPSNLRNLEKITKHEKEAVTHTKVSGERVQRARTKSGYVE
jgi:hypothetical protein